MNKLFFVACFCVLWAVTCYAQTALRPDQISPATPDITWQPGGSGYQIGSMVAWRTDSTTSPTFTCTPGTGDNARTVELTNSGTTLTATIPPATGCFSDGAGFAIQVAAGIWTFTSTSTINGLSSIKVGPYQYVSLLSHGAKWYASLSVPQPPAQTGATVLADNMAWQTGGTPPPTGYVGPGDVVAGALGFWSCSRAYSGATATANVKMCSLTRSSDSHNCDILAASTGGTGVTANCGTSGDNGLTLAAFCGAGGGSCNTSTSGIGKFYDQTGNGKDMAATTQGALLPLSGCSSGAIPCSDYNTAVGADFANAVIADQAQPFTMSAVALCTAGDGGRILTGDGGPTALLGCGGSNTVFMNAGSALSVAAATGAWHAVQAVFNGASSIIAADGTESGAGSPGSGTLKGGSGKLYLGGNNSLNRLKAKLGEAGVWPSAFTSGQRTSMNTNQHAFYGF